MYDGGLHEIESRQTRETLFAIPFFCDVHTACEFLRIPKKKSGRIVFKSKFQAFKWREGFFRKSRIMIATIGAQYSSHVGVVVQRELTEMIGHQP